MTREQFNVRLHPVVIKWIRKRAEHIGVSEACVIEMMAKETDGGAFLPPTFMPGVPIRKRSSGK